MVSLLLEWNQSLTIKKDFKMLSPLGHAAANGHIPAIEVLLTREEVIRDWVLEDWKEKTMKSEIRENIGGKWYLRDEIDWELQYSNMPQNHARRFGNRETFKILTSYWKSLPPDLKARSPALPHRTPVPGQQRHGGRSLFSAAICYPAEEDSRQEQASPGENEPWNDRPLEEIGLAEADFRRAELEAGYRHCA